MTYKTCVQCDLCDAEVGSDGPVPTDWLCVEAKMLDPAQPAAVGWNDLCPDCVKNLKTWGLDLLRKRRL